MQCHHYDAGRCLSCTLIRQPYAEQLADKQRRCAELLAVPGIDTSGLRWLEPLASRESGFRNKAKMVVSGTLEHPVLGILDPGGQGVDLSDCGLYPASLQAVFPALAAFVTRARLTPYDVRARSGELKYLLVTESPDHEVMVRFVLRSQESVARIRKHLPALLAELPQVTVVSANILPEHKAVLEGDLEIVLTEAQTLRMHVDGIDLHLRPQSFFQTNTDVAAALYRQGREWVEEVAPASVWDLYCGVGGFALHSAAPGRAVTGIETSREAIASARITAAELDPAVGDGLRFEAGDATAFALGAEAPPELVIVNPPRRGIGPELAGWLEESGARHVVYSSCNATSLARDLAAMPSLTPRRARVMDMFPQTGHYEVMVLLERAEPL